MRVLVIEPTADDLEAMGQTVEALDGTRMPAVTRQAQRSAASLLADQPSARWATRARGSHPPPLVERRRGHAARLHPA